jgi:hypothetical protein
MLKRVEAKTVISRPDIMKKAAPPEWVILGL